MTTTTKIIAIVGSRDFHDYDLVQRTMQPFSATVVKIVSGGAQGADQCARRYAIDHRLELEEILPDWTTHGRAAGPVRNRQIVSRADLIIAFWNGYSPGTRSTIEYAHAAGKPLVIVRV